MVFSPIQIVITLMNLYMRSIKRDEWLLDVNKYLTIEMKSHIWFTESLSYSDFPILNNFKRNPYGKMEITLCVGDIMTT